jgi:MFS family permease
MIGSVIGAKLMSYGRRRAILIANVIGMVGSILSIVLNFEVILLGRFMFGICAGINVVTCPTLIEETIPTRLMDKGFGTSTAIGINFMIMLYLILGIY